jgi:signal transduction histidine kinase
MFLSPFNLGWLSSFVSNSKDRHSDEYSRVTILLVAVLFTGILMCSYSLNSYFTVGDVYHLKKLCFIYTFIHLFSPLIYRIIPSVRLVTHVFISAGFMFQFHHAFATGGFYSETMIWFSILPLIVGIVAGFVDMLIWCVIVITGVGLQFFLTRSGISMSEISESGRLWSQLNIGLGYMIINVALILAHIKFRDRTVKALEDRQSKIKGLLRILAHDINNPLSLIVFANEILKSKVNDPEIKSLIHKIDVGAEHIKSIVQSTREYEAIASHQKDIVLEDVCITETINEALMILEEKILNKKIKMEVNLQEASIRVERSTFISQVLLNLLMNAVKFSYENSIIEITGTTQNNKYVLKIRDYGVGIPEDVLKDLFTDYVISSTLGTKGERGTGFGMSIAFQVIKRLGGELQVQSSQNPVERGTTFTIKL